jgi:hypothetical protein
MRDKACQPAVMVAVPVAEDQAVYRSGSIRAQAD